VGGFWAFFTKDVQIAFGIFFYKKTKVLVFFLILDFKRLKPK